MSGKYSLLQDYIAKHDYRKVLWDARQSIKNRIIGHEQVISRTELLLHEEEIRLSKTNDSYDRVTRELREMEHLLCDNNEGEEA